MASIIDSLFTQQPKPTPESEPLEPLVLPPPPPPPPAPVNTEPPPKLLETFWVESGLLNAWLIGLKAKSFQSNEKSARDLGVIEVVNHFTIQEMEAKIAENPSGKICFELFEKKKGK